MANCVDGPTRGLWRMPLITTRRQRAVVGALLAACQPLLWRARQLVGRRSAELHTSGTHTHDFDQYDYAARRAPVWMVTRVVDLDVLDALRATRRIQR